MEQSFEASFDDNRPGMGYSEEMLSLMRRIHSMMQAREEREASTPQSSSGPAHPAVASQPTNNISTPSGSSPHIVPVAELTSTQHADAQPARAPDPPNNAFPAPTSNIPVGSLASILVLDSLHEAISDLQGAVTGPKKKVGECTKTGPFKPRRSGLKKDEATQDFLAASYNYTLKYPEDERYHELDNEARVWGVYVDEATAFDTDMVGNWLGN